MSSSKCARKSQQSLISAQAPKAKADNEDVAKAIAGVVAIGTLDQASFGTRYVQTQGLIDMAL
jgi:uncharacterized membrane protein YadS